MKIALGAPIGNDRGWVIPAWQERILAQTLRPSYYCFVFSPWEGGPPMVVPEGWESGFGEVLSRTSRLPFLPRAERNSDPTDPHRATHFSKLRNELRALFLQTDADVFVSLDTDILLDDPTTLERLVATIAEGWDTASPVLFLHSAGEASECYNAGYWSAGTPGDPRRIWYRAGNFEAGRPAPLKIDIPMAAVAIRRHVLGMCAYHPHECGEDLGFADALDQRGYRSAWLTDLRARHVWKASEL